MAKNMTDEEREHLAEQLDKDLDSFIQERSEAYQKEQQDKPPEEEKSIDEIVEELQRHPAFMTEFDPANMSPEIEALQKLKYESESPDYNAENYKDDGNHNFKIKKYHWAKDNYTQGIREKSVNKELNAILYCNRAAAQFHLGNYRSSLNDCIITRKFKPDHIKAVVRGAQCCYEMKKYADAIKWCDEGLLLNSTEQKLLDLRSKSDKLKRQQERDKRKEMVKERKEQEIETKLLQAIQDRNVTLAHPHRPSTIITSSKPLNPVLLASIETHHPSGARVKLDDNGVLQWPVMFMYPEYGQTDFIELFNENARFMEHLEAMFSKDVEPAPWDTEHKYKPERLEMYHEDKGKEKLYRVKKENTLAETLKHKSVVVYSGMPSFIILVTDSEFSKSFLAKYQT